MTVEQMKIIEPRLNDVQEYVEIQNQLAKWRKGRKGENQIYWSDVWKGAKFRQNYLIGICADNPLLTNSNYWDMWHDHLKAIAKDCI